MDQSQKHEKWIEEPKHKRLPTIRFYLLHYGNTKTIHTAVRSAVAGVGTVGGGDRGTGGNKYIPFTNNAYLSNSRHTP